VKRITGRVMEGSSSEVQYNKTSDRLTKGISLAAVIISAIGAYIAYEAMKMPSVSHEIRRVPVVSARNPLGLTINNVQVTGDVYAATYRIWNSGWVGIPTADAEGATLSIQAPAENLKIVYHEIIRSSPNFFEDSCSPPANSNGQDGNAWFSIKCPSLSELQIVFKRFNAGAAISLAILYTGDDKFRDLRVQPEGIFLNVRAIKKVDTVAVKSFLAIFSDIFMTLGATLIIGSLLYVFLYPGSRTARPQALYVCVFAIVIALLPWAVAYLYPEPPF
jgi:hypothetical protein